MRVPIAAGMRRPPLVMPGLVLAVAVAVLASGAFGAFGAAALARTHAVKPHRAHVAIVGGTSAPAGSWPWVAYIEAQTSADGSGFACTGTVVAPSLVLTAGHCAVDDAGATVPAGDYAVLTGALNLDDISGGQVLAVSRVIPAPTFDRTTLHDDAALLVLASPTSAPAIPLAGPSDGALVTAGTGSAIAGWGLTNGADGTSAASRLQQATTSIVTDRTCTRAYGSGSYDAASMVCGSDTATRATSTCNGDSGGPLLAKRGDGTWVESGITSWGADGCSPSLPSVFTRVSHVSGWIQQQIAGAGAAPTSSATGPAQTTPPAPVATVPPVVTPPTHTTPPSITPAPPVAVTRPSAKSGASAAAAGLYRGRSRGGRAIVLRVAAGGRALSGLRFGTALRCHRNGRARTSTTTVVALTPARRWPLAAGGASFRFDGRLPRTAGASVHVSGRFTSATRISGTLRVIERSSAAGSCDSGVVSYAASLR
ncbi:MAG: peptidase and chymotrypsin/Hap [Conexibacter sp.]|nr:peptidase and chymotrypsin/Hap [Conexibacter sp.]